MSARADRLREALARIERAMSDLGTDASVQGRDEHDAARIASARVSVSAARRSVQMALALEAHPTHWEPPTREEIERGLRELVDELHRGELVLQVLGAPSFIAGCAERRRRCEQALVQLGWGTCSVEAAEAVLARRGAAESEAA